MSLLENPFTRRPRTSATTPGVTTTPTVSPFSAPGVQPSDPGPSPSSQQPDRTTPAPTFSTKLMEGDPTKLQDPNKAINDPKYSFLQLANSGRYNYNQLGDMLKELQGGAAGSLWQGWTANGDKLSYTGDPSKLADVWGGVDSVDAIGGFSNFGKGEVGGWRWGADSPASRAADPAGLDALLASLGTQQPSTLDLSGLLASLMQSWKTPTAPVAAPPSYAPAPNEPEDPQGFFQSADPAEMPLFDGQNESVNQALQMMAMGLPMAANQPAGMTLDDQIRRLLMGAN